MGTVRLAFYQNDNGGEIKNRYINIQTGEILGFEEDVRVDWSDIKMGDFIRNSHEDNLFPMVSRFNVIEVKDNDIGGKDIILELK